MNDLKYTKIRENQIFYAYDNSNLSQIRMNFHVKLSEIRVPQINLAVAELLYDNLK